MCSSGCVSDIFLVCLLVLFPPLPVWIRRGFCSQDLLINVILFCLGYFPGLIHLWYIIAKYPPYEETRVYYIYRLDLEHQTPRSLPHGPGEAVIVYTDQPQPQPQPPYSIRSHHRVAVDAPTPQLPQQPQAPVANDPLVPLRSPLPRTRVDNYGSINKGASGDPPSYEDSSRR